MIDQILAMLNAMPEGERAHLMAADAHSVQLRVAAPLSPGERDALRRRLEALLVRPVTLDVEVDPALLAGLEIHFGHSILRNTWRDRLAAAERALVKA